MTTNDPYQRIAKVYDRIIEPMQAGVRMVALDLVPPQLGWQVLDVGCGTGTGLRPYLDAGCNVSGVDVSPAMLDQARDRFGEAADLRLTDGDSLPFHDASFDLVTTSMVLHEIPAEERTELLTEMARVTKPEGRLLLIDFHFGSLRGWKGPTLRGLSGVIERFSGHYDGYRSFKMSGGIPSVVGDSGLSVVREKIVAGGNVAIYVVPINR